MSPAKPPSLFSKLTPTNLAHWGWITLVAVACALNYLSAGTALLVGAAYALLLPHPQQSLLKKNSSLLLKASIVLLGFGLPIHQLWSIALDSFWLTAVSIVATFALGLTLARWLKIESTLGQLITTGTAICGGSAIAAMAPVLKARDDTIAISIAVVFLLNAAGLFAYPAIGQWLQLDQHTFGLWAALGIHDTSSVVGAGAAYGKEALEVATTTKLTRALWILPMVAIGAMLVRRHQADPGATGRAGFPLFVLGFVAASVSLSLIPPLQSFGPWLAGVGKAGLIFSLFLLGAGLSRQLFKQLELKPLLHAVLLWAMVSVGALLLIKNLDW